MKRNNMLPDAGISAFCMELSLLLHAGISAADGICLLLEDEAADRPILQKMAASLDQGLPLSAAMEAAGCFPAYVTGLVAVGEETGRLEEALSALSAYYDNQERLSRRIRSALLYPALTLLMMLIVIAVLLIRVLPVFDEVFRSLGGELSGLAGGLLQLGRLLDAGLPLLCVLTAGAAAFLAAFAGSDGVRARVLQGWQARRGDRGISRKVASARFAQAMAMCLKSGLSAEDALQVTEKLQSDNPFAAARIRRCGEELNRGAGLAEAMGTAELLPAAYCRMLSLGLRSGTGDAVMEEIARRAQESNEQEIETKVNRVEPALVIVTSILVGIILLSVMLPLMNVMAAIG